MTLDRIDMPDVIEHYSGGPETDGKMKAEPRSPEQFSQVAKRHG